MNEFITLSCPSCGGKLNVEKNSPTYICEFCGQTHKLREQDIESFGRCPICHRNDRVEKLTAIMNKHDQLAMKFRPPENLKAVWFYRLVDSTKPEKSLSWIAIDEKQESIYSRRSRPFVIGSVIAFLALIVVNSIEGSGFIKFLVIVLLLGCLSLIGFSLMNWYKGRQDSDKYYNDLNMRKTIQIKELKNRYDKIYYCQRDDLLFIPGEEGSAPGSNYENYITKALDTSHNN